MPSILSPSAPSRRFMSLRLEGLPTRLGLAFGLELRISLELLLVVIDSGRKRKTAAVLGANGIGRAERVKLA